MKSKIKEKEKNTNKPFPKLMRRIKDELFKDDMIILAKSNNNFNIQGIVIYITDSIYPIGFGFQTMNFSPTIFEDFNGEVILSND